MVEGDGSLRPWWCVRRCGSTRLCRRRHEQPPGGTLFLGGEFLWLSRLGWPKLGVELAPHVVGIEQSTRFYVREPFLDRRHEAVPLMHLVEVLGGDENGCRLSILSNDHWPLRLAQLSQDAGGLGLELPDREHVLRQQHWLHG